MKLHDILISKASRQELAHFYIVETSAAPDVSHEVLLSFIHNFIAEYFQKIEGQSRSLGHLMDHPDVFVIGNTTESNDEKEDKPFKVEEASALNRFFEFRPVESKRKFAVITEGHRITTIVANKWLKLLEEPHGASTIFLLNPRGSMLLPTIHSRAIHLKIHQEVEPGASAEWQEFLEKVKQLSLSQFLDEFSRGSRDLTFWINELIRWESIKEDNFQPKEDLTRWLKEFQEMEVFHQPTATKWTLFYSYLHKNVLDRLN